jgi:choline dehydrogenase-like flavoprotein
MGGMAKIPESTRSSLAYKLAARARERWPELTDVEVTHRAGFAYVTGTTADGEKLRLCRLRYGGSASIWGFAIYRASHHDYHPSMLPSGATAGSPEDALDTACGLYLGDPTAWITPLKN